MYQSSARPSLVSSPTVKNGLKSINSASTVVYKVVSPQGRPVCISQTVKQSSQPQKTSTISLSTLNYGQKHQNQNLYPNQNQQSQQSLHPSQSTQSQNQQNETPIFIRSPPVLDRSSQIFTQIRGLDNSNKEFLKILDRINQTSYLKQTRSIYYSPPSQSHLQGKITKFQNQISNRLKQLTNSIREFYLDIDTKIQRLAKTVAEQHNQDVSKILNGSHINNLTHLSVDHININNLSSQYPTSNGSNKKSEEISSMKYDNLSHRIKDLQTSLHSSKQNQGKLINIIETLVKDKDSIQTGSINTVAGYHHRNLTQNQLKGDKTVKLGSKIALASSQLIKDSHRNQSRVSLYQNLTRYDESAIAESIEHLRIYDDNTSEAATTPHNQSQIYINKLYSKKLSSDNKNLTASKKSLRKDSKVKNNLNQLRDKKHRMDYLLNSLHQ